MSEVILFDLDGTLTDSGEGITKSVQYALQHFGIEEPDLTKLECFVGPPLKEQFMKYCRFTEKQAEIAVSVYRERYTKKGIYENKLYEGIESVLRLLKAKGKVLGVASSKPTVFVKQILEHFQLAQYFDVVVGAELDGTRTKKAEVIEYALELLGMQNHRTDVLMVGDRSHDVEGALKCGLQCVGVAYGYGGIYELETAGAVYIAQTVEDLKILAGTNRKEPTSARKERIQPVRMKNESILTKIWRILYPMGIHYGISLVLSVCAGLFIGVWYGVSQNAGQGFDLEIMNNYIYKSALLMTGIVSVISIPILYWFYRKDCIRRKYESLGQQKESAVPVNIITYIVTVILMISVSQLTNELIEITGLYELFPYYTSEVSEKIISNQPIAIIISVLIFLGPIAEELVFRGLIFKRLQDYIGTIWAVLISSLLFGMYHQNMVQFVYAGLLGLVFAMLISLTGSLKITMVAHIAANAWSVAGPAILNVISGGNDTRYIVCLVVMAGIAAGAIGYFVINNKKIIR